MITAHTKPSKTDHSFMDHPFPILIVFQSLNIQYFSAMSLYLSPLMYHLFGTSTTHNRAMSYLVQHSNKETHHVREPK